MALRTYPYAFHVALDGSGLNGLEGRAGVCVFRYDPADEAHAYKVTYFDGVAGGHAVIGQPAADGRLPRQHRPAPALLRPRHARGGRPGLDPALRDPRPPRSRPAPTWSGWTTCSSSPPSASTSGASTSTCCTKAERLGPHQLKLPHAMKRTASGRYVVLRRHGPPRPRRGPRGRRPRPAHRRGPADRAAHHLLARGRAPAPRTCSTRCRSGSRRRTATTSTSGRWPTSRSTPTRSTPRRGEVIRHWSAGREVPAHINSDVCISDTELIFCTGGSQTSCCSTSSRSPSYRLIDEHPTALNRRDTGEQPRRRCSTRSPAAHLSPTADTTSTRCGSPAARCSTGLRVPALRRPDAAVHRQPRAEPHHGLRLPVDEVRLRVPMPDLQEFDTSLAPWADPRLGFHHCYLVSPTPAAPIERT